MYPRLSDLINDLLGITSGYVPRFVKQYADLKTIITDAATSYRDDVRGGEFPGPDIIERRNVIHRHSIRWQFVEANSRWQGDALAKGERFSRAQ